MQLQLELVIRLDLMKDKTEGKSTHKLKCTIVYLEMAKKEMHTRTDILKSQSSVWEAIMDE